ncbi:YlzJ-like family protein [Oceanobacillus rekensis]|uniref:YlzJ-like family protein n=1 Tax=Oceanobacillus rekensis TaxID=937927 RepID=UPI000B448450|nr:YlzJ-like family protein [Oceanobacillus rekensis]
MILYTPLAQNDIFPMDLSEYDKIASVTYNGRTIHAERLQDGTYQIQQLLSSDPQDFLNTDFSPGRIIN